MTKSTSNGRPEMPLSDIIAVVPAAGVGKRMKSSIPKQYLKIGDKTILEHTVLRLLDHPSISHVVIAISDGDEYFSQTCLKHHDRVRIVSGGKERADSVLSGLKSLQNTDWVMVHDAARPCVALDDIDALIAEATTHADGAILACPVRDTMKRGSATGEINETVCREQLWHALTPQMFNCGQLLKALEDALNKGLPVTDEASAIELSGSSPKLVTGSASNIKVTQPEDLALATFYLSTACPQASK
ncbi:2-C-methyl-D-erythritol 4-phosphate cytidylyltransferase [Veronia nyctiphanis]|uniref:2-C-methyl-D-erythritol 4-phosphate cytidylyltransferase n=1 Tax=Veronia nyctiphanis TaxID=1278244 RepID=A0A4Q0YN27_9GAMM|nr:2-C-methyl-D-erythritol 4-phosphate cytidylyltransferase [Veronia nyctiphanis]RXJ72322.1 2-C-methyl-D-erythritol 4-phosphate cytidylyltransferase [Veronia nyctiphanis]